MVPSGQAKLAYPFYYSPETSTKLLAKSRKKMRVVILYSSGKLYYILTFTSALYEPNLNFFFFFFYFYLLGGRVDLIFYQINLIYCARYSVNAKSVAVNEGSMWEECFLSFSKFKTNYCGLALAQHYRNSNYVGSCIYL